MMKNLKKQAPLEPHCPSHLADELNVLPLNVLHHHDLHLVEEVQGKVTQGIPVGGRELSIGRSKDKMCSVT